MSRLAKVICLMVLMMGLSAGIFSTTSPTQADSNGAYESGQIIVKLTHELGVNIGVINALYGTSTLTPLAYSNDTFLLNTPANTDLITLVEALNNDAIIEYATLNYINTAPEAEGSSHNTYGWGGDAGGTGEAADNSDAHLFSRGDNVIVAVLDTGIQQNHPLLIDSQDIFSYDFIDGDAFPEDVANGVDDDGDGIADELHGHGTHVAGIIHNIAPDALLMHLRVLNADGRGNDFTTANAILYAVHTGASVINLSLGSSSPSPLMADVIAEAANLQVPVIAAAGNMDSPAPIYPAAFDCAIGVTSVNNAGIKSPFANYGDWVGIAATGEQIYSAVPNGYGWWSGTSMATPHVAGQAALLYSADSSLSLAELGALLGGTATDIDGLNGEYAGMLGAGQANMLASLQAQNAGTTFPTEANILSNCY